MYLNIIPPPIHTAYNPVMFEFRTTESNVFSDKIAILQEINDTSSIFTTHNISFYESTFDKNTKTARTDLRLLLASFFQKPENRLKQSFKYSIRFAYNGANQNEASSYGQQTQWFTLVRSVVQITESNNLDTRLHKLLTPFNQLLVYDNYPADVSILANAQTVCKTNKTSVQFEEEQVARIDLDCNSLFIEAINKPLFKVDWDSGSSICRQALAHGSDPFYFMKHTDNGHYNAYVEYKNRMYLMSSIGGIYYLNESGEFIPTKLTSGKFIQGCVCGDTLYFIGEDRQIYYLDNADDSILPCNYTPVPEVQFYAMAEFNGKLYITSNQCLWVMDSKLKQLVIVMSGKNKWLTVVNDRMYMYGAPASVSNTTLQYLTTDNRLGGINVPELLNTFSSCQKHKGKYYFFGTFNIWELNPDDNTLSKICKKESHLTGHASIGDNFYLCSNKTGLWQLNLSTKQIEQTNNAGVMFSSFSEFSGTTYFGTKGNGIWYFEESTQQIYPTNIQNDYALNTFAFNNTLYFFSADYPSIYYLNYKTYFTGWEAATMLYVSQYNTPNGSPIFTHQYYLLDEFTVNELHFDELTKLQFSLLPEHELTLRIEALIRYAEQCEGYSLPQASNNPQNQNSGECIVQHISLNNDSYIKLTIKSLNSVSFALDASDDWHVVNLPSWVSLSQTKGKAGQYTITATSTQADTSLNWLADIYFTLDYYSHTATCNLTQQKVIPLPDSLKFWLRNMGTMEECRIRTSVDGRTNEYTLARGEIKEFEYTSKPPSIPYLIEFKAIQYKDNYGQWQSGGTLSVSLRSGEGVMLSNTFDEITIEVQSSNVDIAVVYDTNH